MCYMPYMLYAVCCTPYTVCVKYLSSGNCVCAMWAAKGLRGWEIIVWRPRLLRDPGWLAGKCVDAFYNTHWDQHGVCVIMNSIIISLICAARRINCSQGKQLAKASGVAGALILRGIKNNLGRFGVMYPISPGLTPFAIPIPRTLLLEHLPFVVCHLAFWHGRCCSPALLYSPVCVCWLWLNF